jgi:phosphoribosylformimino-5-aminoimidazole carboxamide ribotide isomerase
MKELGIKRVIFTDTSLDGTLQGPNIKSTKELAEKSGLKIIASGGVSSLQDIKNLLPLKELGVEGVNCRQSSLCRKFPTGRCFGFS